MMGIPSGVRVYLALEATDMRKSHQGLSVLVEEVLKKHATSGHIFVFFNRSRNRVKLLFWDRTGFWLHYKRLERGCFSQIKMQGKVCVLSAGELHLLLEGIDLTQKRLHAC